MIGCGHYVLILVYQVHLWEPDADFVLSSQPLKQVKCGTSVGLDALYGRYLHRKLYILLSPVFNCMIIHGFKLDKIMDTLLVTLLKDQKGKLGDVDNLH